MDVGVFPDAVDLPAAVPFGDSYYSKRFKAFKAFDRTLWKVLGVSGSVSRITNPRVGQSI